MTNLFAMLITCRFFDTYPQLSTQTNVRVHKSRRREYTYAMKNVIAAAIATLSVVSAVFFSLNTGIKATRANVPAKDFTVVIDAGHGGIDSGVSGASSKVKESDLNLDIARDLKDYFEAAGIKVVMTRESSAGLYGILSKGFKMRDMEKRKEIINSANADLMVSVHLNFCEYPERRGAQAFYRNGSEKSKRLAESIQEAFNADSETGRDYEALKGDYYVLNESECPAALCECGFLSNEEDEKLLLTEEHRKKIAYSIYKGSLSYLVGLS